MLNREFKLKPSKQYFIFISILTGVSVMIMLYLPVSFWIRLIGIISILSYGVYILWYFVCLRSPHSIISIRCKNKNNWQLLTQQQIYHGELLGDSTVTGIISILRFRSHGYTKANTDEWTKTCIVFRDALEFNSYRQLLVVLNMSKIK